MCALGYYLEREGIMTTGISLVRENAEAMRPPRTLWVSFPLGRPLGMPADPDFQHGVIASALALLDRSSGPVLEDYPLDAPATDQESAPVCPVSFPRRGQNATWQDRLLGELNMLAPWYELSRRRRAGRTLVGASNQSMQENLHRLGDLLDRDELPETALRWFKLAIEDAKAYYLEALSAQPGSCDHTALYDRLWHESELGAALLRFHQRFQSHPRLGLFARMVVPRDAVAGSIGDEITSSPDTKERPQ